MKIIIASGRNFNPSSNAEKWLIDQLLKLNPTHILCGMCRGADMFGYKIAKEMGIEVLQYPANWDGHGKNDYDIEDSLSSVQEMINVIIEIDKKRFPIHWKNKKSKIIKKENYNEKDIR